MIKEFFKDYVLFDIETTGLSPESDEVVELSALKVTNGEVVDEFSVLVNPGMHIPFAASSINGITDDMVKDALKMDQIIKDFVVFIGSSVLMGHNIKRFDLKFLQRDAVRFLGKRITNNSVDTLFIANRYLPDLESHSLETLACHYGISYEGAHRALADCYINKQVYDCLIIEMKNPSEAAKKVPVCPRCGNTLKKRTGVYGDFWGCRSYPDCKYTQDC